MWWYKVWADKSGLDLSRVCCFDSNLPCLVPNLLFQPDLAPTSKASSAPAKLKTLSSLRHVYAASFFFNSLSLLKPCLSVILPKCPLLSEIFPKWISLMPFFCSFTLYGRCVPLLTAYPPPPSALVFVLFVLLWLMRYEGRWALTLAHVCSPAVLSTEPCPKVHQLASDLN